MSRRDEARSPRGFYVYAHRDADGNIFYIGKGTGRRAWNPDRHPVWRRYVGQKLAGEYTVDILQDELTEHDALELEARLIEQLGTQLINWINPGRGFDYAALADYWRMRKASQQLIEQAKQTAKEDAHAAIPLCREALALVHEYSTLTTETGMVEQYREKNRSGDATVGDPNVIYRLALCLEKAGHDDAVVSEVDDYFARYPDAVELTVGRSALKVRARAAARINKRD